MLDLSMFNSSKLDVIAKKLNFKKCNGLIPVVTQDFKTKDVLMLAFMNDEALAKTLTTGIMYYWSRNRDRIWKKGEESGHVQHVKEAYVDCDLDALLFKVDQTGNCCHTGHYTCFFRSIDFKNFNGWEAGPRVGSAVIEEVFGVILDRLSSPRPSSYVSSLTSKGEEKILQKLGEEMVELVLASKTDDEVRIVSEATDLLFHIMVLLAYKGINIQDVFEELKKRRK